MTIAIVNGPNLNLTGIREPALYGVVSIDDYLQTLAVSYPDINFMFFQHNVEGELITFLHSCRDQAHGIVLNAGAYTHTSIALADAVAAIQLPVIEVHISNILAREEYRKQSYIASRCIGSISGLGLDVYRLGVEHFRMRFREPLS